MECPKCLNKVLPSEWRPPAGLDPHLVRYKCHKCHLEFYVRLSPQQETFARKAKEEAKDPPLL